MNDLFAATPSPRLPIAPNRTAPAPLAPRDEFHLYLTDHTAWTRYIAPRYLDLLRERGGDWLVDVWPTMSRSLQRAVWDRLPEDVRSTLRTARESEATGTAMEPNA